MWFRYPEWGEPDAVASMQCCLVHDPSQRSKIQVLTDYDDGLCLCGCNGARLYHVNMNASEDCCVRALILYLLTRSS
jgi:hypothetical protein